jgi:hypothetical protein
VLTTQHVSTLLGLIPLFLYWARELKSTQVPVPSGCGVLFGNELFPGEHFSRVPDFLVSCQSRVPSNSSKLCGTHVYYYCAPTIQGANVLASYNYGNVSYDYFLIMPIK